jgi:hypothetical protein
MVSKKIIAVKTKVKLLLKSHIDFKKKIGPSKIKGLVC